MYTRDVLSMCSCLGLILQPIAWLVRTGTIPEGAAHVCVLACFVIGMFCVSREWGLGAAGANVDIKKSSYKKLSTLLKKYEKKVEVAPLSFVPCGTSAFALALLLVIDSPSQRQACLISLECEICS